MGFRKRHKSRRRGKRRLEHLLSVMVLTSLQLEKISRTMRFQSVRTYSQVGSRPVRCPPNFCMLGALKIYIRVSQLTGIPATAAFLVGNFSNGRLKDQRGNSTHPKLLRSRYATKKMSITRGQMKRSSFKTSFRSLTGSMARFPNCTS